MKEQEEQKVPEWRDLPPHIRTKITKMERNRGFLFWDSKKNGTYVKPK